MSAALAEDEVIVTLSCIDPPPTLVHPQRRLLLTNKKNTASIGRASKRSSTLESRMYNGWIDAPVMSREHAELKLDSQSKMVFIRDVGSLHGTFHNDIKLHKDQYQILQSGDLLKFGICIDRGNETFPQCAMKVLLDFGQARQQAAAESSLPPPLVFQVPDDSESEDMDYDTDADEVNSQIEFGTIDNHSGHDHDYDHDHDDQVLRSGAAALAENGLELEFHGFDASDAIDLTSEPDLVSEDNIPSSSPISEDSNLPIHHADHTLGRIELDDETEFRNFGAVPVSLTSDAFAPTTQVDDIISLDVVPGLDGPLSEDQHLTATSEISPSIMRAKWFNEPSGKERNTADTHNVIPPRSTRVLDEAPARADQHKVRADHQETPADHQEPHTPVDRTLRKRKAEQISDVGPSEVAESRTCSTVRPEVAQEQEAPFNVDTVPTYKRIKTAAEYVGLMAIGGVAVMTALIATAPNF